MNGWKHGMRSAEMQALRLALRLQRSGLLDFAGARPVTREPG